jgi:hypothetical protein
MVVSTLAWILNEYGVFNQILEYFNLSNSNDVSLNNSTQGVFPKTYIPKKVSVDFNEFDL